MFVICYIDEFGPEALRFRNTEKEAIALMRSDCKYYKGKWKEKDYYFRGTGIYEDVQQWMEEVGE